MHGPTACTGATVLPFSRPQRFFHPKDDRSKNFNHLIPEGRVNPLERTLPSAHKESQTMHFRVIIACVILLLGSILAVSQDNRVSAQGGSTPGTGAPKLTTSPQPQAIAHGEAKGIDNSNLRLRFHVHLTGLSVGSSAKIRLQIDSQQKSFAKEMTRFFEGIVIIHDKSGSDVMVTIIPSGKMANVMVKNRNTFYVGNAQWIVTKDIKLSPGK
jgi:hypothetical protein